MAGSGKHAILAAVLIGVAGFLSILHVSPRLGSGSSTRSGTAVRMACATTVALLGAVPRANAFATAGSLARTAPAVGKRSSVGLSAALRRYWSMSTETGAGNRKSQVTYLRSLTGSSAMSSSGDPKTVAAASAPGVSLDSTGPKRVLVPIADGSEEIESVTIIDTLVRAGASVTVASVGDDIQVTCSRGVKLVADCKIADCEEHEWDAVVCPGGLPGADHLRDSAKLVEILKKQNSDGRIVAAICAAPAVVLASHGLLDGKKATCYPAPPFQANIPTLVDSDVVTDGNIITSRGPGTSMAFALQIVEALFGRPQAASIGQAMLVAL